MRSFMATNNLMVVSANAQETAINTEQTLDTCLLCDLTDILDVDPQRENNADQATGHEEPDTIYDDGLLAKGTFTFSKAQAQHFAFLLAYALGQRSSAAAGIGYQHTITPISGDVDISRSVPSFTAAQRYGLTVLKRRFASMFVDQVVATFAAGTWCKIAGTLKGTGKKTDNIVSEIVNAAGNATSLTLAANGVNGSDAATRLANVQQIKADLLGTGVWTEVAYSAVSGASPAVITITAPAVPATAINYKIIYIATETGWMTFPARITEDPLRIAQMSLIMGGGWNGTAFVGGRPVQSEIKTLEWTFQNNLKVEQVPGAGGAFAGRALRDGRTQKIKCDKQFRDFILQQHIIDNDTFGIYILAQGALYDATNNYQVEIIFPKVGVLTSPISLNGKRLAEAGDIQVLEDSTYSSVIVRVKNKQTTYAG
jgi:hypothetical protein